MITDEDVEKIACSVFAKLVARWDERAAEGQRKKEEKERIKKEKRNKLTKVQVKMLAALSALNEATGDGVYEDQWRAKYGEVTNLHPGALRVAFHRYRDRLVSSGHVINENERFLVASQKASQKTSQMSQMSQNELSRA